MKRTTSIWLFISMVFILPLVAFAVLSWYQENEGKLPLIESALPSSHFRLHNQNGDWRTEATWKEKIVVANFFFSHCPVICPKMMLNMKKVQEMYDPDPGIRLSSFSIDPERDSITTLKKYAERYQIRSPRWDLLTGPKAEIYKLARNGFLIIATDGDGGTEDFIHSQQLVLVDTKQQIRGYYDGTSENEVAQLINDIKKLKNEN